MKISATQIDNKDFETMEIYLSGCKEPHCAGCHNPELWDFEVGENFEKVLDSIIEKCLKNHIKRVWVLGGEPLDQNLHELERLLKKLVDNDLEVCLFTRYSVIPMYIFSLCSYIKFGAYQKHLEEKFDKHLGITLASSNQNVIKLKKPFVTKELRSSTINLKTVLKKQREDSSWLL